MLSTLYEWSAFHWGGLGSAHDLVAHGRAPARGSCEPLPWASIGALTLLGGGCLGLVFFMTPARSRSRGRRAPPSPGLFGGGEWIRTRRQAC